MTASLYSEIDKELTEDLADKSHLLVELPTSQCEYEEEFSLPNDSLIFDKVELGEVDMKAISQKYVDLPTSQQEFEELYRL